MKSFFLYSYTAEFMSRDCNGLCEVNVGFRRRSLSYWCAVWYVGIQSEIEFLGEFDEFGRRKVWAAVT